MKKTIKISIDQIKPDPTGVLQAQGIPSGTPPPDRVKALYDSAEKLFLQLAEPIGIISDISIAEFTGVYKGNGMNEADTPLEHIFPRADHLALFAFTLGAGISREIERQFETNNMAVGYMLDAVASYSADKASERAEEFFLNHLVSTGEERASMRALLYSPGYCGWHVSGQEKLFQYLEPEQIGIRLNKSFLMIPLKSISGVLVAGDKEIHHFKNNYPFCKHCRTRNCRERIKI